MQLSVLTRGSVIVWHHLSHILNNIYCISFLCMACVILVVEQSLLLTVGESVPQFLRNLIVVLVHLGGKRLLTQLANRDLKQNSPRMAAATSAKQLLVWKDSGQYPTLSPWADCVWRLQKVFAARRTFSSRSWSHFTLFLAMSTYRNRSSFVQQDLMKFKSFRLNKVGVIGVISCLTVV